MMVMTALFVYFILSTCLILSLSIDVPAEMKSCPIGMFCPIGANCTNNTTLCVVTCPTESDIMQQGNHITRKCEKVPDGTNHWMDSTFYEVLILTNQTLNVNIRDILFISSEEFRTNDFTYFDLVDDITFTLNGSCPYFYFTNMLKKERTFENYYDYYVPDDIEAVSLALAEPVPLGDYKMEIIVTNGGSVLEKHGIMVYVRRDINDECLNDNGGCGHMCMDTQDSFKCSCRSSYQLAADNKTCVSNVTACNFTVEESYKSGRITTSGFPNIPYAPNSNCTWIIELPGCKSVELKFDEVDIEESANCTKDRVTILNGNDVNAIPLGSYCGNKVPNTIQSSTEVVAIQFISDDTITINKTGFNLQYRGLKERTKASECLNDNGGCAHMCMDTLDSFKCSCRPSYQLAADNKACVLNVTDCFIIEESYKSGRITTSGFPNTPHAPNSNCTWIIDLPGYKSVELKFDEVDIEESPNCAKDRVTILNGNDVDAIPLESYCGNKVPRTINSSTEVVTIQFISDGTVNKKGFNLQYRGLKERTEGLFECPALPRSSTTIGLSTFPSKYNDSFICQYNFNGFQFQKVKLTFLYLDIVNADCNEDKIEIYDNAVTAGTPDAMICNGNKMVEFTSRGSIVRMIYTGNSVNKYRGFLALVEYV